MENLIKMFANRVPKNVVFYFSDEPVLHSRYCLEEIPIYVYANLYDDLWVSPVSLQHWWKFDEEWSLPYVLVHNVNNYCLYVLHICPVLVSRRGSCYGNRIVLHARFEMAFTTPRVYPNAICFFFVFCFFRVVCASLFMK